VHLVVDSAVAHLDLEGSLNSPGGVPGVNAKPVVQTAFSAPTDNFDGVATELSAGLVNVDSA